MAATPESAPGLMFLPSYVDVMVKSPLLDVEFSQVMFLKIKVFKVLLLLYTYHKVGWLSSYNACLFGL